MDGSGSLDSNKEAYIYLDLNKNVSNDFLSDKMFIRIVDLHKLNPLVQVNDILFQGTYSHSIGTNLFFEKTENRKSNLPCSKEPAVTLKPLLKQTKMLICKPKRVPPQKAVIPDNSKNFEYNWSWDYNELLKRFEDGILQLQDIVKNTAEASEILNKQNIENDNSQLILPTPDNQEPMDSKLDKGSIENTEEKVLKSPLLSDTVMNIDYTEKQDAEVSELKAEYESLVKLARRPVKRVSPPEMPLKCDPQFQSEYEYKSIESKVLHASCLPNVKEIKELNEETLCDHVDIDRCVLYGLISPSNEFPRTLTDDEKQKIFNLENFENLSLPARYYVLKEYLIQLESFNDSLPKTELENKDEYGRTPIETLTIYRRLCKAMKSRIAEIIAANECSITEKNNIDSEANNN